MTEFADLPAWAQANVRQILRGAARRLLAERLDGDPTLERSSPRGDGDRLDRVADQPAPLLEGELAPPGDVDRLDAGA
jgi:hypothetical protein